MPRKLPVQYPGPIHHRMNRGDLRAPTFLDAKNRRLFLDTLSGALEKAGCEIHAWCLLSNHFHLVPELLPMPFLGFVPSCTHRPEPAAISFPFPLAKCHNPTRLR
jgi:REP element-mobilizing transposase RayT